MSQTQVKVIDKARQHSRNLARGLLLCSLVYVTWRFGGVDAAALVHVSLLLIAASVFAILGQPKFGLRAKPLPVVLLSVIGLSVAWPFLQVIQLPESIYNAVATGQHEIDANLVDGTYMSTAPVLESIPNDGRPPLAASRAPRRSITVVRSLTESRIHQWVLMSAYVFLTALLFDSRDSRRVLLWTLAVNAGLLAVWGLIQRATGSTDLLPGITRSTVSMPFGTFVYKNAGAAALIPGFAAAIALLWPGWISRHGSDGSKSHIGKNADKRKADFEYRSTGASDAMRLRFQYALIGICSAGVLMSYSRGAWLGTIVAASVIVILIRRQLSKHVALLVVGIPALICLSVLVLPSGTAAVVDRIDTQISTDYIYADSRWEHLREGLRTARKYFPVGSGIGTYGYATLAEQQSDSMRWFREAHNHYLETLAEQGLPGLLLLLVGGTCILKYSSKLLSNRISRERSAIGIAGLAALIAISTQSLFDFVILIPAVMFLFASLFGAVAQTYATPIRRRNVRLAGKKREARSAPAGARVAPALFAIPVLGCLVLAHFGLQQTAAVEQVLAETRPIKGSVPNPMIIEANLDLLNESIVRTPDRADLLQRRAYWNTIQLRVGIRRAAARADNAMSWEATSLPNLFQRLMILPASERYLITDEIAIVPDLRQPLRLAIVDLQASVDLNPFDPQSHQMLALLAPTAELESEPLNARLCRLSHSSPRTQFLTGMIAHYNGNQQQMLDQWQRALRGTCPEFGQMVRLCNRTMSVKSVLAMLIPPDRMELSLPFVRALEDSQRDALSKDSTFLKLIEHRALLDDELAPGRRYAMLGWIATELRRDQAATAYWKLAVQHNKSNVDFRYQYCRSLLRDREFDEVFRQCSLGQSLEPKLDRFQKMAEQARQNMMTP